MPGGHLHESKVSGILEFDGRDLSRSDGLGFRGRWQPVLQIGIPITGFCRIARRIRRRNRSKSKWRQKAKLATYDLFNGKFFVNDSNFESNSVSILSWLSLMFTGQNYEANKTACLWTSQSRPYASPSQPFKLGRDGDTGADGICIDKNGTIWFGNFGNGYIYALRPNDAGEYKQENVETVFDALNQRAFGRGPMAETKLECCDGMFYDANLDCVYINDSVNNAVWMFTPVGRAWFPIVLWMNDDSDGKDGLLDSRARAVVYRQLLASFDYPFPAGRTRRSIRLDDLGIDYAEVEKFVTMWSGRPRGLREVGQGQGQGQGQGLRPRLARAANAE